MSDPKKECAHRWVTCEDTDCNGCAKTDAECGRITWGDGFCIHCGVMRKDAGDTKQEDAP